MTTLACRYLDKYCVELLSAADSSEIQKVFLIHIHAKHQQQWDQLSRQSQSVSLVTMRDRFSREAAQPASAPLAS